MNAVASLLAELVGIPTQQSSADRAGGDELALCKHVEPLMRARGADEVVVVAAGRGADDQGDGGYVYARWGQPSLIINAHVDTVPANNGWSRDPWTATVVGDRLHGLGACDTKGAIAAAIVALDRERPRDVGLLFSGDEERGTASMRHFLKSPHRAGVERAIVCEPTARRAGVRHRGVLAYRATTSGEGGHSSRADRMARPIATLARLAVRLDDFGKANVGGGPAGMQGLCMNVAGLDGGIAFNVVPTTGVLTWSLRPWPGFDRATWDATLAEMIATVERETGARIALEFVTDHAPFGTNDTGDALLASLVRDHATELVGLDFWTEAALYEAAGMTAIVIGPGDIAQAHAADEFVTLADLDWAVDLFADVYKRSRDGYA
ncbi:MAG TPA: M20/M25/M40 family metallo-hydrolase [Kofleriaceae bacterium]|nr:M20/M25/M40 family metallo-hydrolase [Kofleriaceae bacterium]